MDRLTAALAYAARGWAVFPLQPGTKEPYPGSHGFKDASTDQAVVTAWWEAQPEANIGLATGPVSGVYVLDVDEGVRSDGTAKTGSESLEALEQAHGALPTTPLAVTPRGGRHLFFAYPEEGRWGNTQGRLGPDLDTRGDGGYVVLAPSSTEDGAYEWVLEPGWPESFPPVPEHILALLAKPAREYAETHASWERSEDDVSRYVLYAVDSEVSGLGDMGPDSGRNERLNRAAFSLGTLGARGEAVLSEEFAREALVFACERNGLLTEDGMARVLKTFYSGWKAGLQAPREPWPPRPPQGNEGIHFDIGPTLPDADSFFDRVTGLRAFEAAGVVYRMGPLAVGRDDQFWEYQDGVWVYAKTAVRNRSVRLLRNRYRPSHAGAIADVIKSRCPVIECDPVSDYLNTQSGMVDWKTGEVVEHDPSFMSTVQFPWKWDATAECPEFEKFLRDVFPEDMLEFVWEFIGYTMYSGNPLQLAFLFFGEGANGKGTLLRVLNGLLGKDNVSAATLDSLNNNKFTGSVLYGKIANIAGDIDATYQESTAMFKKLTGEDYFYTERKYGDQFGFTNWALPIFSANKIPGSADTSEGYRRRWIMVPFPRSFLGQEDRHLSERLAGELPGIALHALPYLRRLMLRGRFDLPPTVVRAQNDFARAIDVVREWVDDACVLVEDYWATRASLYASYKAWCQVTGGKPLKASTFYERLARAGFRPLAKAKEGRGFVGLRVQEMRMMGADSFHQPG